MSYRGPALNYQIRKTTTNNQSGDNYAITIPRVIAEKYQDIYFRVSISGNCLLFTSGAKLSISDITEEDIKKVFINGGKISFK